MYTWGEYNSPKVIKEFETEFSLKFTLDSYNSNEQMIAKLAAAGRHVRLRPDRSDRTLHPGPGSQELRPGARPRAG